MTSPLVDRLVSRAFGSAPPSSANQAIAAARAERNPGGREARSYEVVLPALAPDAFLTGQVLPRLVHFLDSNGLKLPGGRRVFLSLFTPEGLFFIDSDAAVTLLAEARGLDLAELERRYGLDGAGDPPLLGG